MELLGIDVGFGFTKATNGKEFIMFKSVIGEATELQFWSDLAQGPLTNNLHVSIDDKSYFVGDLAERQSDVRQYTLDQEKLITEYVKVLALTMAGLFCEKFVPLHLVSGLPVGYFRDFGEKFTRQILGHHNVNFMKADGSKVTRRLNIAKVRMVPQPFGSVLNLLMSDKGKIVKADMARQKLGVIDVGFRTTDIAILDKLQYINRGSRTMDTGMSEAFRTIANKLREKTGISMELYRLYEAVGKGSIKVRGQEITFVKMRDQVYAQIADEIAKEINTLWADEWDMDAIVLTGGGCMELARHLQPLVIGNVIPMENEVDARLNNVQGYFKYARHLWADGAPAAGSPAGGGEDKMPQELKSLDNRR
ncbi:MAG: hypothetical protein ACLFOY_06945 [Desulfatibacillaceae bacterium]